MNRALILILTLASTTAIIAQSDDREARIERSPQHRDGRFFNAVEPIDTRPEPATALSDGASEPDHELPVEPRVGSDFDATAEDGLRVTWMGHATMLLELDGTRILTDPIWSERAGPSSLIGPSRFHPAPLELDALPTLDLVVISHDHYDHLDRNTITALAALQPTLRFAVPLGVGARLEGWGIAADRLIELDWWGEAEVKGVRIVCTPARHFSGRGIGDRDATLWASWAFVGPRSRVYFGGDTGMFEGFEDIGQKLGPFDLTVMPIGAYNDRWADIHITPEQAIQAHAMLQGRLLVPIHWGTFDLAFHPWDEPVERLRAAAEEARVVLALPRPGERVRVDAPPKAALWWEAP